LKSECGSVCDSLQDVITVWIALDDMTEELGAKKLPPFSR
jgi:ectoine hydroxylase-related dioxygenase (phytanoyl-CoA dioxygenase family)